MFSDSDNRSALAGLETSGSWSDRLGAMVLERLLAHLTVGRLTIELPGGGRLACGGGPGPEARLTLNNWRAARRIVSGGDIGFAEGYIAGDWTSPDLVRLVELAAANGPGFDQRIAGLAPARLFNRLRHATRRNSRKGSRRNIAFHYDLGNEFYRLWLDPGLVYSSALYSHEDQTLEAAQALKLSRIRELLELRGGERVLEIGCGWGALAALLAASGAHVTGLTLSQEQLAHAQASLAQMDLGDRADLRLKDYRDVEGEFDRIVSIEMLEAVGEAYWARYFATLRARLAPGGTAVLQVITIAPDRFETYRRRPDFIQRYVFPGGMLPTPAIVAEEAERAGLEPGHSEHFGLSYARTLAEWRRRFLARAPELHQLGFDARFMRMWDYYLAYCEAGFRAGAIDVGLYILRRPIRPDRTPDRFGKFRAIGVE